MSESTKELIKKTLIVTVIVTVAALLVVRFDGAKEVLGTLWDALFPFLAGLAIAFVLNLVMKPLEGIWFPKSTNKALNKMRRPVCLIASLVIVLGFISVVVGLLSRELRAALGALGQGFSYALQSAVDFLGADPRFSSLMGDFSGNLNDLAQRTLESFGGAGGAVSVLTGIGGEVAHGVVAVFIGVIFALYALINKERIAQGVRGALEVLLPEKQFRWVDHAGQVANDSFSRFVTGQCLEACILGCLCALGMKLIGLPYAGTIGLCVGITSLVPYIGAWVGGAIGALIVASISVEQAIFFVVFLVILQQIEGHFIYPNVVGNSVGMPGIWTFFAVTFGGSLFGLAGILLGVPVVSTIRTLVLEWKAEKTTVEKITEQKTATEKAAE